MVRIAQLGIALAALGVMTTLMGLFPGMTGLEPTRGIGVIQILVIIVGLSLLILGAMIYVKFMFYASQELTLLQQIGTRLALTGLTFTAITALADVLGFGSNLRAGSGDPLFGPIQIGGLVISFAVASLGVLIFAMAGDPEISTDES